tara:strand:+ start:404 stop:628 length:225 start_codon:yes stop_codon:yes gene_type:complete
MSSFNIEPATSTLNPDAKPFIPQKMSNIILQALSPRDQQIIDTLDKWTNVALDNIWLSNVHDAILKDQYEKQID